MPFNLYNVSATFQRIINDALRDFLEKFVIIYLDNIFIYSDSDLKYKSHLQQVFKVLEKHDLLIKPSKYTISATEIEFYTHIIS
jgi:hypothetical protein